MSWLSIKLLMMNMIVIVVVLFVIGVFVNIGIVIMSRVCSFPDAI